MGGTWPAVRHDGSPHLDETSQKMAGKPLGLRGLLVEVRCDWAALKEVWDFPSWRSRHFCWQCKATRDNYKVTHLGATWRTELLDHWDFLRLLQRNGGVLNPLLGCPMVSASIFKLDWLHVCDQGITQRFIASVFSLWLEHQRGSAKENLEALWLKLQEWYEMHAVEDGLQNLTTKMLKSSDNGFPKLRGSAAVVRKLVPFARELCGELDQGSAEVRNCSLAAGLMVDCYEALREENAAALEAQPSNSRKLATLLVLLESLNETRFHCTPKLHLFQHLAESGSLPSRCWTYRDEDFGGSAAAVSRRRGGLLDPAATSAVFLERWFIKTSVTQIVTGDQ